MRAAQVLYNGQLAGILSKEEGIYRFTYDRNYLASANSRPVSLTLPLRETPFESNVLFPAFINRLSEGANKTMQSRLLKIDEKDMPVGARVGATGLGGDFLLPADRARPLLLIAGGIGITPFAAQLAAVLA
ncbi:MAG TPA: HipA N-terminal domain-containing protein, partial [Chitinophaga sp.]